MGREPVRHGAGWIRRHRAGSFQLCARTTEWSGHSQHGKSLRPGKCVPSEHASEQVQRRRKPGASKKRPASIAIDAWNGERWLYLNAIEGADSTEELEGRPIAAEEDVLAVVDEFSGFTV